MKLNLLLFFIFGVSSASASGIRGISPIKGSERRMLKKTSSESESTSTSSDSTSAEGGASNKSITIEVNDDDEVVKCSGSQTRCNLFYNECTTTEGQSTKKLNNRVRRRLKAGSSSGSSADNNDIYRLSKSAIEDCRLGTAVGDSSSSTSTSTSSDTSKKSRRTR